MSQIKELYNISNCYTSVTKFKVGDPIINYPLFTCEKQINLIKLLCKEDKIEIAYNDNLYCLGTRSHNVIDTTFEEALARYINSKWFHFDDSIKEEIRKILK